MTELIMIAGGALISALTQVSKKIPLLKDNPRLTLVSVSVLVGIAYGIFTVFLPDTFQQSIVHFWGVSTPIAVMAYEFLKKIK